MHIPVGTVQQLKVHQKIKTGYLIGNKYFEVPLSDQETVNELDIGDIVKVFLYNDRNHNIVGTTNIPSIQINTYDWAEVVEVIPQLGVFVHIGIEKDILVSIDDLPVFKEVWPKVGDKLYVTLGKDQENRLLAIPAQESIFMNIREIATEDLLHTTVTGHVYHTSREGTAIFSMENYRGFIHHTEREQEPRLGELVTGRVIDVKDDGTINVSLLPLKHERITDDADVILTALENNGGILPYSDKSKPADIRKMFGFSKSAFKRALGRLMKERKVEQRDGKTYLIIKK